MIRLGVTATPPVRRAPPQFDDMDPDAIKIFYDVLAAYGAWNDDSRLGLVWTPAKEGVGEAFVPYATNGRWTNRDAAGTPDWVWVSDSPWGWVTFHYGRWAYTGDKGWAWVAGRQYSGGWVDWRTPHSKDGNSIVGWGPTPPTHVWRVSPDGVTTMNYSAFATPYVYARTRDIFAPNLNQKLLPAGAALAVAYTTEPGTAPAPEKLGWQRVQVPAPPMMDRGLQQAWMLATPATASAVGAGPELAEPPRLRSWVAGGPRYDIKFTGGVAH